MHLRPAPRHRPRRAAAGALLAAVMLAALAGCAGGPRDSPGYRAGEHGVPAAGTIEAEAAIVGGIAARRDGGSAALHLGAPQGPAPWAALVVVGADVGSASGTLFLRGPEVHLEGPLAWTLGSMALSADNLTGMLRADAAGLREALGAAPQGADLGRWQEHSDARFWSEALDLRPSGAVTVNADSVVLATQDGLRDLGTGAVVQGGSWRATAPVRTVEPPALVVVADAPGPRVQVFLAQPRGTLELRGHAPLALAQATVLDARAPDVRLEPAPGGVRAELRLVAFQVYHGGEPVLPARVVVEPAAADVALREARGSAAVRVREAGGDADAVFKAVRTGGSGRVSMPGFQSVWDSWPPELRLLLLSGPWAVNFVFANVFMEGLRLLTGQYLPQPLHAGQEKEVSVTVEEATPGEQGTVTLEGRNFPDATLSLRYR